MSKAWLLPNFFHNLPKKLIFLDIDNLCDTQRKFQKRKPTQQLLKKKQ
jgi:hypothetical protein